MSKEYETELEKTIEHLHKVIEEKTKLIDQQREMLDKFISGDISINHRLNGYTDAPSYVTGTAFAGPGPVGSIGQPIQYDTIDESHASDES